MVPIRKGDGTTVMPDGIGQVRTGDGRVLFEGDAIPDSAIEQFHAKKAFSDGDDGVDISSWSGELGNYTVTGGNPVIRSNGINGNLAIDFDGVDDILSTGITSVNQPTTVILVVQYDASEIENTAYFDGDTDFHLIEDGVGGADETQMFAGNSLDKSGVLQDSKVMTAVFDGANSSLRENGTEVMSGDAGANALDGFTFAARDDGSRNANIHIGVVEPHDVRLTTAEIEDREQALAEDYDILLD